MSDVVDVCKIKKLLMNREIVPEGDLYARMNTILLVLFGLTSHTSQQSLLEALNRDVYTSIYHTNINAILSN